MRHKAGYNKLSRKASHRKALMRNMATSLFKWERIKTTKARALEVRRTAEKMITRAKDDSVHNRRMIARKLYSKAVLTKLFTEIGPRFKERPGGYTRILKLGRRKGDAAEMVFLELIERKEDDRRKKGKNQGKPVAKSRRNESKGKTIKTESGKVAKRVDSGEKVKSVSKKTRTKKESLQTTKVEKKDRDEKTILAGDSEVLTKKEKAKSIPGDAEKTIINEDDGGMAPEGGVPDDKDENSKTILSGE